MSKWVTVGLAVVAIWAMAGSSLADVPSASNSSVSCYCTANAGGTGASSQLPYKCSIGPDGGSPSEDIHVDVIVRNVNGVPLAGSTVVCTGVGLNGAVFAWDSGAPPVGDTDMDPQTKVSIADGSANFLYDQGGVTLPAVTVFPTLNYDVTAQGPGAGAPVALAICSPALDVVGFDMDSNCLVDGLDLGRFTATWTSDEAKGNFNFDAVVDGLDLGLFTAHWNKTCDLQ
jgi:hypothetical protein